MRYFEIEGNKPDEKFQCRALPFDNALLGSNKDKLANNNVFYKAAPGEILNYNDLETKFNEYGKIKSLKISLNPDHSQKGFAYVCFENQESANAAAEKETNAKQFEQKDSRNVMGKLVNNMYFKNIPTDMKDDEVKQIFAPFGHIKSLVVLDKENMGKYGFVCYEDPNGVDKQYGPNCVKNAIDKLINKDMGNNLKLYVR